VISEQTDEWINLVQFFEVVVGKYNFSRDTDLYEDLDMEPYKIRKVLMEWAAEFSVNMEHFDIAHYYPSSKLTLKGFFLTVIKVPFSRDARETLGGWQITLGMLERAMIVGRWEI